MDILIGIDLGSTSLKAIAYDLNGNVIAQGSRPTLRFYPSKEHPEWTIWDPDQIWNDTALAIADLFSFLSVGTKLHGVAVTGMGMDGVPMDADGNWLYPFISWHDPRTKPQFDAWIEKITAATTFAIGGNPVWPINSALRMLWIKENEPTIFRKTYKWLLIEDFVNYKLCGRYSTDYSMASCTMLFDQRQQTWSEELCRLADLPISILPEVLPSATFLGGVTARASEKTGLPIGTPVFLGGHDHICSGLPVGAFRPGKVMDITGTWETVHIISDNPGLDPALANAGVTIQSHVLPKRYSMWGGNPAGEMLEWYRREIASSLNETRGPDSGCLESWDWSVIIDLAQSSLPGAGGVLFLPHLGGSSCPVVDPQSLGVFAGMSTRTKQADLIRAVFEGLDFQFLETVRAMERATGTNATELIAVGGAIRNVFWMQNKADVVGRPVRVPEIEEATVLGAAILAGIGSGVYANAEEAYAQVSKGSVVYEPNVELTAFYAERFPLYQSLYQAIAPVNHAIFQQK